MGWQVGTASRHSLGVQPLTVSHREMLDHPLASDHLTAWKVKALAPVRGRYPPQHEVRVLRCWYSALILVHQELLEDSVILG